MSQGQDTVGRT